MRGAELFVHYGIDGGGADSELSADLNAFLDRNYLHTRILQWQRKWLL
jgi:hypothetical protein